MSKKNSPKNSAEVIMKNIHITIRQIMRNDKVDGVTGFVSDATKERVEITFDHNNEGDKINKKFWFNFDQVNIFQAF